MDELDWLTAELRVRLCLLLSWTPVIHPFALEKKSFSVENVWLFILLQTSVSSSTVILLKTAKSAPHRQLARR
ncbi:hypothetical protein R3P38DRAFT_3127939 [Favolaschia claudopus]|uniref:Uncharacterized protein n=1 Tax=Favolaschia claudopus TaxID=2862362 RepID=A0AAV9Z9U8_9AGAR